MLLSTIPLALLPLAFSAPTKKTTPLSCVQFQYEAPFTSFGANGFIHLYSNVTVYDSDTETTRFNETRLGLNADGTIEPCGTCQTTELFGFEVCQNADRDGFEGLANSATIFYGHILYTKGEASVSCLSASSSTTNGSSLVLAPCEYDYDTVASSGQYFEMETNTGGTVTRLVTTGSETCGPNADVTDGEPITLSTGTFGGGLPFTYFGFKSD
ncbi:hypothetical protein P7C73_g1477, partial [Tremellales sp. Uapishka_1]